MESLSEYRGKTLAAARAAFVEGCWTDAAPDELVKLAEAASMPLPEADKLRQEIEVLKGAIPLATTFPRRQEALEKARATLAVRNEELAAAVDRAENDAYELATEVAELSTAASEAERAVAHLADAGDAVAASVKLPPAVLELRRQREPIAHLVNARNAAVRRREAAE